MLMNVYRILDKRDRPPYLFMNIRAARMLVNGVKDELEEYEFLLSERSKGLGATQMVSRT